VNDAPLENRTKVARWLFVLCGLVFAMIILGGVTRLTGSGLSMVDWRPIVGVLPPLDAEGWERAFERYRESPEFRLVNPDMDVEGFKGIFWLEYLHRLLGRLIGLVFAVPFLWFVWKGYIRKREWPKYALMFVLGGLQGLLGWYMVKSGLVDNPRVSQYRLAAHLTAAVAIYAYMFWVGLSLLQRGQETVRHPWFGRTLALTVLVSITVLSGAFVAGLDAGLVFNTFPKMGEYWIPPGALALEPWWLNFFENVATVQFDHRLLAVTTFVAIVVYWWFAGRTAMPDRLRRRVNGLLHVAVLQVALGVSTLLLMVPMLLAAAHQATALILFTLILYLCHGFGHVRAQ
jgi:heme a synthase